MKKIRGEKGQSIIEFALVLPILLMFLGMAFDIGRVIDAKILVQSASSESIRQVTSRSSMTGEINGVLATYYDRLDQSNLEVLISGGYSSKRYFTYHAYNNSHYPGYFVDRESYITYFDATVELTYKIKIITPMAQLVMGKEKIVNSKFTRMITEGGFSW